VGSFWCPISAFAEADSSGAPFLPSFGRSGSVAIALVLALAVAVALALALALALVLAIALALVVALVFVPESVILSASEGPQPSSNSL